jgi:hypothetical protein
MKATIQVKNGLKTLDLNRRRAIREKCLNCCCWVTTYAKDCIFGPTYEKPCPLWPYRMGTGKQNAKARNRAIKDYCLWCMGGNQSEIPKCVSPNCALFNFRSGAKRKMAGNVEKTLPASVSETQKLLRIARQGV